MRARGIHRYARLFGLGATCALGLAAVPPSSAEALAKRFCFTCHVTAQDCGPGNHWDYVVGDVSDIWKGGYHGLNCTEGNCSSNHSWYYNCGESNETWGGGVEPGGGLLADLARSPNVLVNRVRQEPTRFIADMERNLVRRLSCTSEIVKSVVVSPEVARAVAKITAPELILD